MTNFNPIKGTHGYNREANVDVLDEDDRTEITDLLVGHKVTKVSTDHLVLDDGTVLKFPDTDGGCACSAGCYDLTVLNGVDNIITAVGFDYRPASDGDYPKFDADDADAPQDSYTGYYRIFVFADAEKVNLAQWNGSDGNGYYGTGFSILVRKP